LGPPFGAEVPVEAAAEVTTFIAGGDLTDDGDNDGVAALETAIENASSLGLDTSVAEEHVASNRGLLSLRVTWGSVARFCLLPVGVAFTSVVLEVTRRFGLAVGGKAAVGGSPPIKLSWLFMGSEIVYLHDQASWEACLHRCSLYGRPGRLELRLEVPFVITGRRVATPCTAGAVRAIAATGVRSETPRPMVPRRQKMVPERQRRRMPAAGAAGGWAQPRKKYEASGVPPTGHSAAGLHLEGHSATTTQRRGRG